MPGAHSSIFIPYSPSPSPATRKRARLDRTSASSIPATPTRRSVPALPHSPYRFDANNEVVDNPSPEIPLPPVFAPTIPAAMPLLPQAGADASAMLHALDALEARSHLIRQAIAAEEQSDKETAATYARQVRCYEAWWILSQARLLQEDPTHVVIPAFPITAAKVTVYLEYETTRPQKRKRDDNSDSTATIGISGVKQVVSALENWRFGNQHKYLDVPAAQIGLRLDIRIKTFESAAAHKEPQRVKMAHTLKAKGTNADTFTATDLMRCASWCLTNFKGPAQTYIGLRDRAMLLTSCSVAFRGDSTRSLLLSDLFVTDVIMNAKGLGVTIPALTMLADNAKHNQTGRTDEHGAFRHRYVELCPIGSIAFLLFSFFHVRNAPVPTFAPDFSDTQYGDYGKREWYGIHLFPPGNDPMAEMGYDNHRKRVNLIYEKNGVNISKVTHAGREFSVKTAREYGASVDGAKALGGWSDSGSFKPCYDRALPVDALLGAAMFDGARPESHFLPREFLEPPSELVEQIFPWVGAELAALEARERKSPFARDIALHQLFKLLVWFRTLLLQDAALIYVKYPNLQLWRYPPFNSPVFRAFAGSSVDIIEDVEARARLAVKDLPQNLVRGFQGAISSLNMAQRAARDETRAYMLALEAQMATLTQYFQEIGGSGRRVGNSRAQPRDPVFIPPPLVSSSNPTAAQNPVQNTSLATNTPSASMSSTGSSSAYPVIFPAALSLAPPPPPLASPQALPIIGHDSSVAQTSAWNLLALRYTDARMRRHQWNWIEDSRSLLPIYTYPILPKITDYWTEWASGLDGHLSIRELNEGWNAKWKRDIRTIKNEYGRRSKVIALIERLSSKPNWNLGLALRFIRETYEGSTEFRTARSFCEWLQSTKTDNINVVLQRSCTFIH